MTKNSRNRARMRMCSGTGESFQVKPLNLDALDRRARASHGRRTTSRVRDHRGRYVGAAMPEGRVTDLAVDATVRAASPFQIRRGAYTDSNLALKVESWDLRQKVRESQVGNLVVFLVDSSGSMGAQQRMVATKGAVISLLMDAYQRRDRVAMIAFRGVKSEVVLPRRTARSWRSKRLDNLPTGGRTPMAQALADAQRLIRQQRQRSPDTPPLLAIVSDCRANVGIAGGDPFDETLRLCEALKQDQGSLHRAGPRAALKSLRAGGAGRGCARRRVYPADRAARGRDTGGGAAGADIHG